ncbi:hypothetical protein A2U01_0106694, partial [Trifolium medium]|nr:hypothetical protein [Trifolium medium]
EKEKEGRSFEKGEGDGGKAGYGRVRGAGGSGEGETMVRTGSKGEENGCNEARKEKETEAGEGVRVGEVV